MQGKGRKPSSQGLNEFTRLSPCPQPNVPPRWEAVEAELFSNLLHTATTKRAVVKTTSVVRRYVELRHTNEKTQLPSRAAPALGQ